MSENMFNKDSTWDIRMPEGEVQERKLADLLMHNIDVMTIELKSE